MFWLRQGRYPIPARTNSTCFPPVPQNRGCPGGPAQRLRRSQRRAGIRPKGEIPEPHEEPEIIKRQDGTYLVDGQCSFYNFLSYFKQGDLYSTNEYNTLGGLILEELGHIPRSGEILEWKNFKLEVMDMDGARIDKVLVSILDAS